MACIPHEITVKSGEYRPCIVGGRKGLFHRWIENEQLILKFEGLIRKDWMEKVMKRQEEIRAIPPGVSSEKLTTIIALVEFEDECGTGRIERVDPTAIQFLDTGNIMHETAEFHFWDAGLLKGEEVDD